MILFLMKFLLFPLISNSDFEFQSGEPSGEIGSAQEPLLKNESKEREEFSVVSTILP